MKELDHTDLPPLEIVEAEVVEPGEGAGRPGGPAPDAAALGLELPEDRDQALALLLREVDQARNEATSYLDDLRRVAADFDNFRKRALREQQTTVDRAAERVVRACLPVLDSLDAALTIEAQTETERNLLGGMLGTRTLLLDILGKEGLEVVPTWGEAFDPEMHEAVVAPTGGEGSLVVAQELRRGYRLKGKVLRAALVSLEYE